MIVKRHFAGRANFSKFVRLCLLRYDAMKADDQKCPVEELQVGGEGLPAVMKKYGRCTPRVCMKHWPNGPADLADWRRFREMKDGQDHPRFKDIFVELGDLSPEEWIDAKAKIKNKLVGLEDMDLVGNAKKSKFFSKPLFFYKRFMQEFFNLNKKVFFSLVQV